MKMKTLLATLLIPILLLLSACEKHPVSDLEKIPGALATPTPAGG
jgi:hypothetical protein